MNDLAHDDAETTLPTDRLLGGRYRLDRQLASGGMANVYAARHRNGARVAIKILKPYLRDETMVRQRFLREPYIANAVDHPGVVQVVDDGEDPLLGPFLVMELLEGETLESKLQRTGKLAIEEALRITMVLLDVLEVAHARGILHRDVKPANVFLCADGRVRLLDFGLARSPDPDAERLTLVGVPLGTPAFMAPEQARGECDECDGRTDLYAVGATLFRMLSGRHPREGSSLEVLHQAAFSAPPRLREAAIEVDSDVCALVDRSMANDARERWSSAFEMATEVERLTHVRRGRTQRRPPPATMRVIDPDPMGNQETVIGFFAATLVDRRHRNRCRVIGF